MIGVGAGREDGAALVGEEGRGEGDGGRKV